MGNAKIKYQHLRGTHRIEYKVKHDWLNTKQGAKRTRCKCSDDTGDTAGVVNERLARQLTYGCFLISPVSPPRSNHSNTVSSCCFTDSGRFLCTASWDRSLQLWDLETGAFRSRGGLRRGGVHVGSVSSCAFSSDGEPRSQGTRTLSVCDVPLLLNPLGRAVATIPGPLDKIY